MASGSQDWHARVFSELGSGNLVTQKKTSIMVSRNIKVLEAKNSNASPNGKFIGFQRKEMF